MSLLSRRAGARTYPGRLVQLAAFGAHAVPFSFLYLRLRWEGIENVPKGPAVLALNHTSIMDGSVAAVPIFLAQRGRLVQWMAAEDQVFGPWGPYIRFFSTIPVTRGKADWRAYRESLRALEEGRLLGMFHEGGVTRNGHPRPFEPGAAWLALSAGVPLVPATMNGTFQAWPRERSGPRPGRVEVIFHPPIRCDEMGKRRFDPDAPVEVMEQARETIMSRYRPPEES